MKQLTKVIKPIKGTTEVALQRAMFMEGCSVIDKKTKIDWLDIELPVVLSEGNKRNKCVDLIGRCNNHYVLCELKFWKPTSHSNPPMCAYEEVSTYYKMIQSNCDVLEANGYHHPDGLPFSWIDVAAPTTELIIIANREYWEYWKDHRNMPIPNDIKCYMIDVPSDEFDRQKEGNEDYLPYIETNAIYNIDCQ